MKRPLTLILTLLLTLPSVLGVTKHTVRGDLQSFGRGIEALLPPNTNMAGFIDGMLGSLPLFGLIAVVFGFMFFVTKITIFKSPDHDRYARMIALGIAILGLAQQSVYNSILGLATSFLILGFLVAIVFMFIMFLNYSRRRHIENYTDLHNTTATSLQARRNLEKIRTDLRHEQNLYNKIDRDLGNLDSDLQNTSHLVGNELAQVDKLANMLRKATAASQAGSSTAVKEYVNALSRDVGSLVTTMQHEQHAHKHLNDLTSKIEQELARWGHEDSKEKSEEERLQHLFKKLAVTWGHDIKDNEIKDLYKKEHRLIKQLRGIHKHLHELQSLFDKIMGDVRHLDDHSYEKKHLEANAVRDNIMNQQFNEAHKHLDNLRAIIESEPHWLKRVRKHENELRRLLSVVESEERKVSQLIKVHLLKELKSMRDKSKGKVDNAKEIAGHLHDVLHKAILDLRHYAGLAHDVTVTIKDGDKDNIFDDHSKSYKETFDLPRKLFGDYKHVEHDLQELFDHVKEKGKDPAAMEKARVEAVNHLNSIKRSMLAAQKTVQHAAGREHSKYAEVLSALTNLLEQSVNGLYTGNGSIIKRLEDLKKKN